MEKVNLTVKRSGNPNLPYESVENGDRTLHRNSGRLITYLAEATVGEYHKKRVRLTNEIPKDERDLGFTLDLLIGSHNRTLSSSHHRTRKLHARKKH